MDICARCLGNKIGQFFSLFFWVVGFLPAWYWGGDCPIADADRRRGAGRLGRDVE